MEINNFKVRNKEKMKKKIKNIANFYEYSKQNSDKETYFRKELIKRLKMVSLLFRMLHKKQLILPNGQQNSILKNNKKLDIQKSKTLK